MDQIDFKRQAKLLASMVGVDGMEKFFLSSFKEAMEGLQNEVRMGTDQRIIWQRAGHLKILHLAQELFLKNQIEEIKGGKSDVLEPMVN